MRTNLSYENFFSGHQPGIMNNVRHPKSPRIGLNNRQRKSIRKDQELNYELPGQNISGNRSVSTLKIILHQFHRPKEFSS